MLAEAGWHVLPVERGAWLATHDLRQDHLRNHRVLLGYTYPAGPPTSGNPRVVVSAGGAVPVPPPDPCWHNTAMTVGGRQHQAGTCRMGSDPRRSVTDAWGGVWGHANLHIVDGALHVTNGGVNPVLTILALAYRVSRHVAGLAPARGPTGP